MANKFRLARRWTGNAGTPASLLSAEPFYNGVDDTFYLGYGDDGSGVATSIRAVGGAGAFLALTGNQTIAGLKTFSTTPVVGTMAVGDDSTSAASTAFVKTAIANAVSAATIADGDKGDITVSSGGSVWSIDAGAVTNAKLANMANLTFKGRVSAGAGVPEDLTVAQMKTALNLTGTNSGDQTITLTGDVTGSGTGSFAATIANNSVTNAKAADMAVNTIKGRVTAGTGDPEDLTAAQVKTLLSLNNVDNTSDANKPVSTAQQTALNAKAPLASPAFTGTPTAPTAVAGTNTTQLANTAFVQAAIAALIDASPGALDTLNELAAALGDDPNFATTVTNGLAEKLAKASNLSDLTNVATARSNLGLGSMALQNTSAVAITGGTIDGVTLDGGVY